MIAFPLDAVMYEYAQALGAFSAARTRGVVAKEGFFVTTTNGDMTLNVAPGIAWLKMSEYWGCCISETENTTLTIEQADITKYRTDAIVLRINKMANEPELFVRKGDTSGTPNPTPIDPIRNSSYDEIYIATVAVNPGASKINSTDITLQHMNDEYCGYVRDGIDSIPTDGLVEQYTSWFTGFRADSETNFNSWLANISDSVIAIDAKVDSLKTTAGGVNLGLVKNGGNVVIDTQGRMNVGVAGDNLGLVKNGGTATINFDGTINAGINNPVKRIAVNSYTLEYNDGGYVIEVDSPVGGTVVHIPPDYYVDYPVGTRIELVRIGTGQVTFHIPTTVTLNAVDGETKIDNQYEKVELIKTGSDNEWLLVKASGGGLKLDNVYPVGAIYMSINSANPGTALGGTWVSWGAGRVPVGVDTTQTEFNTPQKTGGSKYLDSHRHDNGTLTTSEKALSGTIDVRTLTGGTQGFPVNSSGILSYDVQGGISLGSNVEIKTAARNADRITIDAKHDHPVTGNTGYSGSGNSGNLPPYITCYMWLRTA